MSVNPLHVAKSPAWSVRGALRTALWSGLLVVSLHLFAQAVQAQARMKVIYVDPPGPVLNSVVPATATDALSRTRFGLSDLDEATAPASQHGGTLLIDGIVGMANSAGNLDRSLGNLGVEDGAPVGVVDWVRVQVRVVPNTEPENSDGVAICLVCDIVVTKAALLLSNGRVTDADASDLLEGIVTFEDGLQDFNPESQDLYIAVDHRNHMPALSKRGAALEDDEVPGLYEYDFGDLDNLHQRTASELDDGVAVLAAGDFNQTNAIDGRDRTLLIARLNRALDPTDPYTSLLYDLNFSRAIDGRDLTDYTVDNNTSGFPF